MADIFQLILRDFSEKIFYTVSPGDWFLNFIQWYLVKPPDG